ncbi:DUF4268 domain-containing protein [Caulobacter endophyticus]|uniref:DUF4268 domain-containing protein n=1 Tax=Caulobacter endophyticus TaxID=2172652 RepID=UPI0024108D78|nr:DUF4268 domain-containing protein [Caulobacter endophyticus]MDG2531019.1 DUF4268 domain-containing protein [Caulobacter endophyticus]
MSDTVIGRLERVALREVWRHEAYDFTRWLQENIDVLNVAVGLDLVNVNREQAAGAFSIDLVAEDQGGGKVIIENQLEKSNHDHLGKLLTYLVAMEARAAVWIVSEPRPEHVSAVAWLNESSSADFYLLKVEAVRIGDSPPAPLLTLIVGPSAETEAVSRSKREFSERHNIFQNWWAQLIAHPEAHLHKHITPSRVQWMGTATGVRGLGLNYTVLQDDCGAELYIDRGQREENKSLFDQLLAHQQAIETTFGGPLRWERLDAKRASRISVRFPGGYRSSPEAQAGAIEQQIGAMNRLHAAISPFLKTLRLGAVVPEIEPEV